MVLLLSFLWLMAVFRSIVVPLKAVIGWFPRWLDTLIPKLNVEGTTTPVSTPTHLEPITAQD